MWILCCCVWNYFISMNDKIRIACRTFYCPGSSVDLIKLWKLYGSDNLFFLGIVVASIFRTWLTAFWLHFLCDLRWLSLLILWQLFGWICFIRRRTCTVPLVSHFGQSPHFRAAHTAQHFLLRFTLACSRIGTFSTPLYIRRIWLLVRVFFVLTTEGTLSTAASVSDRRHVRWSRTERLPCSGNPATMLIMQPV